MPGSAHHSLRWLGRLEFCLDRTTLHAVIDYWRAPFRDARDRRAGVALTRSPWIRLNLGYHCPHQARSGNFSTQTNLVRPVASSCTHCSAHLARSEEAPRVRLLT